jgi:CRP-like cAMP-binding protein
MAVVNAVISRLARPPGTPASWSRLDAAFATGEVRVLPSGAHATLMLVLEGLLLETSYDAGGREVVLDVIGPGGAGGMDGGDDIRYWHALTPVRGLSLPLSAVRARAAQHTDVARDLLALTMERAQRRSAHLVAVSQHDALRRVVHELLAFAVYLGAPPAAERLVLPRLTHAQLGELVGLRRETVTLQLLELRRRYAIELHGRELSLNLAQLREIAAG